MTPPAGMHMMSGVLGVRRYCHPSIATKHSGRRYTGVRPCMATTAGRLLPVTTYLLEGDSPISQCTPHYKLRSHRYAF